MKRRKARKGDVDRLLREALVDDLPPDTEGRLRAGLRSSWRTARASASADEGLAQARGIPPRWTPQRALLATAALLALAVGGVVHLEAGAGPLAEPLLAQQTAVRVAAQLQRVSAMSCRLEARDAEGLVRQIHIEWRDTGATEVRIEGPEVSQTRTLHLPREATSVLALARARPPADGPQPGDPDLSPAETHLSPERVASLLAGRWERVGNLTDDRPSGQTMFRVSTAARPHSVRVTIDTETDLPVLVEQDLRVSESPGPTRGPWTRARFVWTQGSTPPRLLNGSDAPANGSPDRS